MHTSGKSAVLSSAARAIMFADMRYAAAAVALVLVVLFFKSAFAAMAGTKTPLKLRKRRHGQGAEDWLLGPVQARRCELGLRALQVRCSSSASSSMEWRADVPPRLVADGESHLYGLLGPTLTAALFRDVVIRPEPVTIDAPAEAVWAVLIDFESYGEWNPFHRNVDIVERADGTVAVRMTVAMGPLLGTIVSTETIYCARERLEPAPETWAREALLPVTVLAPPPLSPTRNPTLADVDARRHILIYGIARDGPSCLRVVWLEGGVGGAPTTFHSYDMIGGYPALLSRGHIVGVVHRGFTAQHVAIRKRVMELQRAREGEAQRRRASRSPARRASHHQYNVSPVQVAAAKRILARYHKK